MVLYQICLVNDVWIAEADQIKAAMCGFTLPASHTPAWARTVSEEDWKASLISRLHSKSPPTLASKDSFEGFPHDGGEETPTTQGHSYSAKKGHS